MIFLAKRTTRKKKSLKSKVDEATIRRRHELIGVALVAVAVLSVCGLLGFNAGFVGLWLARFFRYFFGVGAWLFVGMLFWLGGLHIVRHQGPALSSGFFGLAASLTLALAVYHHIAVPQGAEILPEGLASGGGLLGGGVLFAVRKVAGVSGGLVVLLTALLGAVLWTTQWSLASGLLRTGRTARAGAQAARSAFERRMEERRERRRAEEEARAEEEKEKAKAKAEEKHSAPVAAAAVGETVAPVVRKGVYDQAQDDHFAEETAALPEQAAQEPQEQESDAPMKIVRPKTGAPVNGFMARLKRRAEARNSLAMKQEELPKEETAVPENMSMEVEAPPSAAETEPEVLTDVSTFAKDEAAFSVDEGEISESQLLTDVSEPAEVPAEEEYLPEPEEKTAFSIQYSRDAEPESDDAPQLGAPSEADMQDALARAMSRALGHEIVEEDDEPEEYRLPKVSAILEKRPTERVDALEREIEENARILAQTLEDFRVKADIINACHGPAVTRYELKPAPGVKVSKIENLADDLALALAAFSVRIEPVPGKAAIGVEVPNRTLEGVTLRDVLEDAAFMKAASPLTVGLGIDIAGQAIFADLGAMPHLLIAGATGSGKSVCVNTLITSILFKARPDEVKFIMIDPKMVELSNYNGIPHLMVPVVTDSKKAASVLNWAVQEMEKRYAKFAESGVRKMADYNDAMPEEKMPAIVIIIDELADLMMVAPKDVEEAIFRLAQKARAAGIHLVLATQRPSVDVITGTIKTNIPSRISFAVSSQIDSRTILDTGGAEKLLGKGDMLFYPIGAAKPMRVQGAFISDEEIERLLEYVRAQGEAPEPDEEIIRFTEEAAESAEDKGKGKPSASAQDELLEKAVDLVLTTGQASTSSIQRRFRIGYTRAGRLIDTMAELGIVGPNVGSKPREILMTQEQAAEAIRSFGA
ncbi:MAG: DNA translocase FtsK 4TM domain-containing protein [Schwartzia sp.]|nr:DNA translocase FtsK 4TM domain-containing protein [Schwartzia sp. (in: firmicutes)]